MGWFMCQPLAGAKPPAFLLFGKIRPSLLPQDDIAITRSFHNNDRLKSQYSARCPPEHAEGHDFLVFLQKFPLLFFL
jgi:hypothetical protein